MENNNFKLTVLSSDDCATCAELKHTLTRMGITEFDVADSLDPIKPKACPFLVVSSTDGKLLDYLVPSSDFSPENIKEFIERSLNDTINT